MPRQVDHAQRRRQIAHAVWTVMATRGLDAVSLREVAAEAGVSMGRVQHYFPTKDAMILHACEAMAEAAYEQAVGTPAADGNGGSDLQVTSAGATPRQTIRNVLLTGIPRDDARRAGASVWFAFLTKAAVWPALADVVRRQLDDGQTFLTSLLRAAHDAGSLRRDVDPAGEAVALLALADGLVLRVMVGSLTPQTAIDGVDHRIDELFAGTPPSGSPTAPA
jgi:TetR/AcrR family transcriptional regulator, transcriptional repressor of bet genes